MLTVRKARPDDAVILAQNLRKDDRDEIFATGSLDVEKTIREGIEDSLECYVAVDGNDNPEIVFGVVETTDPIFGSVWMLGTPAIEQNWIQVLRETREWLTKLFGKFKIVGNAVWTQNEVHIRWLRWAGFTFLREVEFNNNTFYEFAAINQQEFHNV